MLESRLNVLRGIDSQYLANGIAAIHENEILYGRPKCGLGIMWQKCLSKNAKFVNIPNTSRACALEMKFNNDCIICINVYMPVDNYCKNRVSPEFQDTLDAIELFVQQCSGKQIIIGGDVNIDVKRGNAHDKYFLDFLERNNLIYTPELNDCTVDYTYHDPNADCFSCIDHFSVSRSLSNSVQKVFKCDEPLNPSYHLPLNMDMNIQFYRSHDDEFIKQSHLPISWPKVSDIDIAYYQNRQRLYLNDMRRFDVVDCNDVSCNNNDHKQQIDMWCRGLINCCLESDCNFPRVKSQKKAVRPNWKCDVKPYREDCLFWHKLWQDAGCPAAGVLYDIKKHTKKQYMYANRRNKRKMDILRKEKMAEAIANNCDRDFFDEIKRYEPKIYTDVSIDDCNNPKDIAEQFAKKYKMLYNSVPSSVENMNHVYSYLQKCSDCKEIDRIVHINEIYSALKHVKSKKSDGDVNFMSNHLLLSCDEYLVQVALLLTAILTHGHQPTDFLKGSIESIPKNNKGNLCDSGNYRGITLCTSLSKVFDIIILTRYSDMLSTSNMQYAFKGKHSTVMCTLVVKEVVRYYCNQSSDVYSCYVDATKAFDRVRYDKLFNLLIERGLPPVVIRALLDLYERQQLRTRWKGHTSNIFNTTNGIRQGGVISPILFCIYIDELLLRLERKGSGCWVGKYFYGAIGYADDLTLLSPSIAGLRDLLNVCEEFSNEYDVKYNPDKTVCMLFSKKQHVVDNVKLNGKALMWVKNVKHLGNYLDSDMTETTEIRMKRSDLAYRVNHVIATLGKCKSDVISKVFNSKCSHFYGAQAWNLEDKNIINFQTMWNRSIRRLFELPAMTHRKLLPLLNNTCSATEQIYCRFVKLIKTMLTSQNDKVCYIARRFVNHVNSIIGANLHIIAAAAGCDAEDLLNKNICDIKHNFLDKYIELEPIVYHINEIKCAINGDVIISGFTQQELCDMLNVLCCD